MRHVLALALLVAMTAEGAPLVIGESSVPAPCPARAALIGDAALSWMIGSSDDRSELDRWCRAVGPPVYLSQPLNIGGTAPPALEDLIVVSWNAHLAEGRLFDLVETLRAGRLTGGQPIQHLVLLVQEAYRAGVDVPVFEDDARSAYAIRAREPGVPDVKVQARKLGLSVLYVPSMRNGRNVREDRGNAIFSTEPLLGAMALELPLERQRRVAIGAAVQVTIDGATRTLRLMDTHLEPLSSPRSLWLFRNPRRRQIAAVMDWLATRDVQEPNWGGTVLGGDFNTIQGGTEEAAYRQARIWGQSLVQEDPRGTHYMGRIDFLFFRLSESWTATSTRLDEKFGSDHYPVMGRFTRPGRVAALGASP